MIMFNRYPAPDVKSDYLPINAKAVIHNVFVYNAAIQFILQKSFLSIKFYHFRLLKNLSNNRRKRGKNNSNKAVNKIDKFLGKI